MRGLKLALIGTIIGCCIYSAWDKYQTSIAIDFYQMWGIGYAMKASSDSLPGPYWAREKYGKILDANCEVTPDDRLQAANRANHQLYDFGLEPTASPLLYTLFSVFPSSYSLSYGVFLGLDVLLFCLSVVILFSRYPNSFNTFFVLSFAVVLYEPFRSDLNLGNVNLFQCSAISIGLYYLEKLRYQRENIFVKESMFLTMVVFAVLLKPNLVLIWISLGISLLLGKKRAELMKLMLPLIGSIISFFVIPCIYFQSISTWNDWLKYISGGKLNFPLFSGNLSTTAVLSFALGEPVNNASLFLVGLGVLISLVVMLCSTRNSLRRLLVNPYSFVAMAIIITLAISPLVWWHYYLILLIPIVWLVNHKSPVYWILGGISLFLASNLVSLFDRNLYLYNVYIVPSCWIPLLIGVLLSCRSEPVGAEVSPGVL